MGGVQSVYGTCSSSLNRCFQTRAFRVPGRTSAPGSDNYERTAKCLCGNLRVG